MLFALDANSVPDDFPGVIEGFANEETATVWRGIQSPALPPSIQKTALRKLRQLNQTRGLGDLRIPPHNRLHPLAHDRAGQHAIWINDQYRRCFRWDGRDAYDVEISDYH